MRLGASIAILRGASYPLNNNNIIVSVYNNINNNYNNNKTKLKLNPWCYSSKEPRLTEVVVPDGSIGGIVVSKTLSLNLNFSFLNWISLLLTSSSYPIVLTRLGGPHSGPYTSRKISRV